MKNKKNKKILIIIIYFITILTLNSNSIIKNTTQVQKEMSETTQVSQLNNQIDTLNAEHDEYKRYIAESKAQLATAITNNGVTTKSDSTFEEMVTNINNIVTNLPASLPNISITVGTSGALHNTPGYIWSYGLSTITFYIINGVPQQSLITTSSDASWVQNTVEKSATNTITYSLRKIAIIDENLNELSVIFSV